MKFKSYISIIKVIVFIGEVLPLSLCEMIHKYSNCKIYNSYGPTECAVTCTYKEIDDKVEKKITIGKPLCNCKLYIVDKYMNVVPVGVEGEIVIGGYGVGKGYLNNDDLTNEKFIKCPYVVKDNDIHNSIMYRTGDIGKWTENGEIECLGRMDFQVKINGHRIELGEIETVVKEINEIEHIVVIDKTKEETGEKYLICYYILKNNQGDDDT
ncbi:AMP-dependent synthetase and ligase [Anaeromyces robustus]|uniref:AMP-dependent synthetase and ligase n=1 Tax=Anaeromyces robustus TaxID=1754192 RepID=A0A1Y1WPF5_9FUNG|nr:AMP-dependent synthetase and ligase [Anaeromyces robustus]|eukprot:ORX75178.1 AMP-dependent synthetase and ligase [Anaeromyces robustus]